MCPCLCLSLYLEVECIHVFVSLSVPRVACIHIFVPLCISFCIYPSPCYTVPSLCLTLRIPVRDYLSLPMCLSSYLLPFVCFCRSIQSSTSLPHLFFHLLFCLFVCVHFLFSLFYSIPRHHQSVSMSRFLFHFLDSTVIIFLDICLANSTSLIISLPPSMSLHLFFYLSSIFVSCILSVSLT